MRRLIGHEIDFLNLTHEQRLEIAVHEAGHALVAMAWEIPLLLVTVRAGATNSGKVMTQPREEHKATLSEHEASVRIALASRAAEKLVGIEPTDSANSDLTKATGAAEHVANGMGFGPTGSLQVNVITSHRTERPSLDPEIIARLDKAVQEVMARAEAEVEVLFKKVGKKRMLALAEALIEQPSSTGKEFTELTCKVFSIADAAVLVEWRKKPSRAKQSK